MERWRGVDAQLVGGFPVVLNVVVAEEAPIHFVFIFQEIVFLSSRTTG
jgi:hypothetical protein